MKLVKTSLTKCNECDLNDSLKVYGDIGKKRGILFLGEAPGENEVRNERVFCGRCGKDFSKGLKEQEIKRKDVTIINTLLCRPPNNRDPTTKELECCKKRVVHTIKKIKPKVIILLGKISFLCLFKRLPNSNERFKRLCWKGIRTMFVYHPAYFLYTPSKKRREMNYVMIKMAVDEEKWDP